MNFQLRISVIETPDIFVETVDFDSNRHNLWHKYISRKCEV